MPGRIMASTNSERRTRIILWCWLIDDNTERTILLRTINFIASKRKSLSSKEETKENNWTKFCVLFKLLESINNRVILKRLSLFKGRPLKTTYWHWEGDIGNWQKYVFISEGNLLFLEAFHQDVEQNIPLKCINTSIQNLLTLFALVSDGDNSLKQDMASL